MVPSRDRKRRERGRFVDLTATGNTVRLETYVVGLVFRLPITSFLEGANQWGRLLDWNRKTISRETGGDDKRRLPDL